MKDKRITCCGLVGLTGVPHQETDAFHMCGPPHLEFLSLLNRLKLIPFFLLLIQIDCRGLSSRMSFTPAACAGRSYALPARTMTCQAGIESGN